jgi:hypothetical protein
MLLDQKFRRGHAETKLGVLEMSFMSEEVSSVRIYNCIHKNRLVKCRFAVKFKVRAYPSN